MKLLITYKEREVLRVCLNNALTNVTIDYNTIQDINKKLGIKNMFPDSLGYGYQVIKLYEKGIKPIDISKQLNVSTKQVYFAIKKSPKWIKSKNK